MIGKEIEVIAFEIEPESLNSEIAPTISLEEVKKKFSSFRVSLKDWKFDREEANNYRGYAD